MPTLLHIDSSVLGDNSVSRKLTAELVAREQALHPDLKIIRLDLAANPPAHLSPEHVGAWFGHAATTPAVIADIEATKSYIDDLFAADIIVIGAPMYNLGIPSQLKAWIDRIDRAGLTFKYNEQGVPVGLLPATKKVYIVSSRGGVYGEGSPVAFLDHQETHLKGVLNFIGLTDITIIRAEGVAIPPMKEGAIAGAQAQIAAINA